MSVDSIIYNIIFWLIIFVLGYIEIINVLFINKSITQ